jgi:hypothetical protein
MSWQLGITLGLVAAAAGYLVWTWRRSWLTARGKACSGGCGCTTSASASANPKHVEIGTLRLRPPPD